DNDGTPAHTTEGRVWLYIRSTAGVWGSKTIVQPDFSRGSTRPILLLDVSNDRAYVIYHDDSVSGNGLNFITHSPMTNPSFEFPCAFSSMPTNNPTSTKQNVTLSTGLIVAASTSVTSTNQIVFRHVGLTFSGAGFLCDVAPRPNGNGAVSVADWVLIGRFAAGLVTPEGNEFQRADANRDGTITISDWVKCGRYAAGLDPITPARPVPER
ncbi:MAG: dockerin type I repeat-containing protein, partial [Pyrinomonadaceae bacterium]